MSEPKKKTKKKVAKKAEEGVIHPKRDDFVCELDEQTVTVENNGKVYLYSMDARDFSPEDIKVKITENGVFLEGSHETEEEIIEMSEEIDLPPEALPSTVEVLMNSNGVLRIQAPLQPKERQCRTVIVSEEVRTEQRTKKTTRTTYSSDMEIQVIRISKSEGDKILKNSKFEDFTKDLQLDMGNLNLILELQGHRVEDIKVTVSEKVFAVQAVAHYEIENPPKEVHRKYLIPDGVNPASFRALLKKNGQLQVDAGPQEPEKPKEAPPPPPEPVPKVPRPPPGAVIEPVTYCWIKSQIVEDPKEVEELAAKCEDITEKVAKLDAKKFEAQIDVGDFKAEELRLKITNEFILIHSETRQPKRQFHKKVLLPANVKPQAVKNKMTPKFALLSITAKVTA